MLTINAIKRDLSIDKDQLRQEGKVPAVFYGPKEENTPITINEGELLKVYNEAGESSVIILKEGDKEHEALIYDIQWNAVSGRPMHIDFYVIEKGKKIQVSVPVEFVGESPAVKTMGGILMKVMHEIEIEALPKDLPQDIKADISSLVNFDSKITAGDVVMPAGVTLISDKEEVIALVQEVKEVVEEAPMDLSSIEVEKKGKEEPVEGEAEAK